MRMMKAIDCKACRNEIEDAAALMPSSAAALAHLEACDRCRGFIEQRRALSELIASSLGTVAAPHDFEWRLRARINADKRVEHRPRTWQGYAPGARAIALAASFVLVIGIAVLLKQTATERSVARLSVETATVKETKEIGTSDGGSDRLTTIDGASSDNGSGINRTNYLANNRARRPRGLVVKSPEVKTEMVASAAATASNPLSVSNDFSSRAAPVINLFSVPVRPPSQAVKVLLDEGQGTMRTVSLQPITFGSQAILERRVERSADEIW
jgi:hypothetical protein